VARGYLQPFAAENAGAALPATDPGRPLAGEALVLDEDLTDVDAVRLAMLHRRRRLRSRC
jgi:hypothetical protein